MTRFLPAGLMVVALLSPARGGDDAPAPKVPATPKHAGLETMKSLAGTWVEADKDGKPTAKVVSEIRVTAAGSAVIETLFPGQPHEMISMYHLDGADLVMTHYCALGNQPKMKLVPSGPANQLKFAFAGGTGFNPAKDMHMHEGTLTVVDADHIEFGGCAWVDGKPADGHCCQMKLVRKK